ncbi:MAG: hypothetical protein MK035_06950 [Dehalococcoidia bacterium]|nr:hypothetical protein [Dehalococcoidia bacterium]
MPIFRMYPVTTKYALLSRSTWWLGICGGRMDAAVRSLGPEWYGIT